MEDNGVLQIWAKLRQERDSASEVRYPLIFHMLDVAMVAQELWSKVLQSAAKRFFAGELCLPETEASRWLSFWAGLHDIGKASPDFQSRSANGKHTLESLGFHFKDVGGKDAPHGIATACVLPELFQGKLSPALARKLSIVVGGHHGVFPDSKGMQRWRLRLGTAPWQNARKELYDNMGKLMRIKDLPAPAGEPGNSFFMFLAGLTSVADWIASNKDFFPYKTIHPVNDHIDYAKLQAFKALNQLRWTGWVPPSSSSTIKQLFERIETVRPVQKEAEVLAPTLGNDPALVIIEAPMGEGKTEAAIYLADSRVASLGLKGYYFALPTMATSDQMFGRVREYLEKRYHNKQTNLMLLHGHAALSAEFDTLKDKFEAHNISDDPGYDGASAGVVASEWFTHRKRGLLAPFGVGTIDQVLLAILQTRHVFVRLFGLAHKTIIIDEVHAYDTYMTTLLERLLGWLAALGSSVVLLSATLPQDRRDALLRAYTKGLSGQSEIHDDVPKTGYPRISWTSEGKYQVKTIDTSTDSRKELQLQMVNGELPEDGSDYGLGKRLKEALADGGCATVICNTVDQAQKVYQALKPFFPVQDAGDGYPELDLLHARYLYGDRKKREERTLLRFGKPDAEVHCADGAKRKVKRPKCALLVATQIIEQSLDLDFDLMVTEMAPVDLLLQRAGRMHRHQRDNRSVNFKGKHPTLWIYQPEEQNGIPNFGGGTQAVYDYHILLRTWLEIKDKAVVKIPDHIEALIESVYDDSRECPAKFSAEVKEKWEKSREKLEYNRATYESMAKENRILPPSMDAEDLLEAFNRSLEEDKPEIHRSLQALTRISEGPSVSVICLNGSVERPYISEEVLDFSTCPTTELTRRLLRHSTKVSNKGLVHEIANNENFIPKEWRKQPLLRHHYVLFFNDNEECPGANYVLRLDRELGLVIQKKE